MDSLISRNILGGKKEVNICFLIEFLYVEILNFKWEYIKINCIVFSLLDRILFYIYFVFDGKNLNFYYFEIIG